MKLHPAGAPGHLIRTADPARVTVGAKVWQRSLVITPEHIEHWPLTDFEALSVEHFEGFLKFEPEVVLLGTGHRLRFPPPELSLSLHTQRIGLEVMDTVAACRTYNILCVDGRRVLAALLIG